MSKQVNFLITLGGSSLIVDAFKLNERGLVGEDWFWDAVSENRIITHYFGKYYPQPAWCEIKTPEGVMIANAGDYIIKGITGEIYSCKSDIFEAIHQKSKELYLEDNNGR